MPVGLIAVNHTPIKHSYHSTELI